MSAYRRPYKTVDGYIAVLPYMNSHWREFCELAGRPEFAADERFADLASRLRNIDATYDEVAKTMAGKTTWAPGQTSLAARLRIALALKPARSWSPDRRTHFYLGLLAVQDLVADAPLELAVNRGPRAGEPIASGVSFTYAHSEIELPEVSQPDELIVATISEEAKVIAYGFAVAGSRGGGEITIIDVDLSSRRNTGLQKSITLQNQTFGVGVGHVLVDLLLSNLEGAIKAGATNYGLRYIFKSLCFEPRPGSDNPCLLLRP